MFPCHTPLYAHMHTHSLTHSHTHTHHHQARSLSLSHHFFSPSLSPLHFYSIISPFCFLSVTSLSHSLSSFHSIPYLYSSIPSLLMHLHNLCCVLLPPCIVSVYCSLTFIVSILFSIHLHCPFHFLLIFIVSIPSFPLPHSILSISACILLLIH